MAQPQILRSAPINFKSSKSSTTARTHGSYSDHPSSLSNIFSTSPPASRSVDFASSRSIFAINSVAPEIGFPGLPPLHTGTTDEIINNNVAKALYDTEDEEPNVERAFFAADLSKVLLQHERWLRCLPGVEPFYAVKCNPDPYVLRLLSALGTGFDCASHGEISQVLGLGVDPSRIIFANPCKATSFVRHAAKSGVDMMTFDNQDELFKIARAHPKAKLVVRILTDDSKSLCRLGLKFGAPLVTVPGLLAKAKELGLDVIGVSFHVGSGCFDSNAFADAVMRARAVFEMGAEVGYRFSLLDVGGGFEDGNFESTAQVLRDALVRYFPDRSNIRVIAEPGRFYVSGAFSLAANVIARHYINDGVYGAFNCIMFDHQHVHPYVISLGKNLTGPVDPHKVPQAACSVWGPTCDSIDCVCPVTRLPANLVVGDWLGFRNMGAYTICAASQFNGFESSRVHYTSGVGAESAAVRRALASLPDCVHL
ncbi:ornithine decarboxylase [Rhizoctonia solani AG-1 IA]|uniref:ornithine decarboxylase n=1 Tax=Thanatephorus cucumeris (strain AG1-IA) TaxID=983506 RepID=L8WQE8_THACA|nr:ornithine decarboxylase [Rhizoctonia solani AG-1 IA]